MKLRNSFLIAAGVFFFAVAFVNFAKAGDDGGENPDGTPSVVFNMTTVYDQDCIGYAHKKSNPNGGEPIIVVSENSYEDGFVQIESMSGKKDKCMYYEGWVCYPTECSSLQTLKDNNMID